MRARGRAERARPGAGRDRDRANRLIMTHGNERAVNINRHVTPALWDHSMLVQSPIFAIMRHKPTYAPWHAPLVCLILRFAPARAHRAAPLLSKDGLPYI
jgi:hypothetical protein